MDFQQQQQMNNFQRMENLQKEGLEHDDNFNKANTLLNSYGKTTNEKISLIASVCAEAAWTQPEKLKGKMNMS